MAGWDGSRMSRNRGVARMEAEEEEEIRKEEGEWIRSLEAEVEEPRRLEEKEKANRRPEEEETRMKEEGNKDDEYCAGYV